MSKLILLLFITILYSCAQEAPKSNVRFSLALNANSQYPGGLILRGYNSEGLSFSHIVDSSDQVEMELPNGKWTFLAMGWKNGSGMLEGDLHCDIIKSKELDGGEVALNFAATKQKCVSEAAFGYTYNGDDAFKIELNTCMDIKKHIQAGEGQTAPDSLVCGAPGEDTLAGSAKSAKLFFLAKNVDGSAGGKIESRCYDFSGSQANTDVRLPFTPGKLLGARYGVAVYDSPACAIPVAKTYVFDKGFSYPAQDFEASMTPSAALGVLRVLLHSDICSPSQVANTTSFASGSGTLGPYLICNKEQFELIGTKLDASFIIGKDIDFNGTNTTIGGEFKGSIEGGNYSITNFNNPLFDTVKLAGGGARQKIKNLNIHNVHIDVAVEAPMGLLANQIRSVATDNGEMVFDNINVNAFVRNSSSTNVHPVGGLIGQIDLGSTSGDQSIIFERSQFSISTTNETTDANSPTGSIFGAVLAEGDSRVEFVSNEIGQTAYIPQLSGLNKIGIVAGSASGLHLREGNRIRGLIGLGSNRLGGVAGVFVKDNRVESSYIELEILGDNTEKNDVGGVAGLVEQDYEATITDSVVKLTIKDSTDLQIINSLGGVIGRSEAPTAMYSRVYISNTKVAMDTAADGVNHGGVFGYLSSDVAPPFYNIESSVITGSMVLDQQGSNAGSRFGRGGVSGYVNTIKARRLVVDDFELEGFQNIGGLFGSAYDEIDVKEVELQGTIRSTVDDSAYAYMGGLIGDNGAQDDPGSISVARLQVDLQLNSATSSYSGQKVGRLSGSNGVQITAPSIFFQKIIDYSASLQLPGITLAGNGETGVDGIDLYEADTVSPGTEESTCLALNSPDILVVYADNECKPLFYNSWEKFSTGSSSTLLAGNVFEPLPIQNEEDWNEIGADDLLMNKSFKLSSDIQFTTGAGTVTQIGTSSKRFNGKIIANGKRLVRPSGTNSIFASIGHNAQIGSPEDPLYIEELELECLNDDCGFVGVAESGRISAVIKNGTINAASSVLNIGGLVGRVADPQADSTNLFITHSGFSGNIIADSAENVGGLVGYVEFSANPVELSIENSYSRPTRISAVNNVGGVVGRSDSYDEMSFRGVHVYLNPNGTNLGTLEITAVSNQRLAGLVGHASSTGMAAENVIIDYSQANLTPDFVSVQNGGGYLANPDFSIVEIHSVVGSDYADGETVAVSQHISFAGKNNFVSDGGYSFNESGFRLDSNKNILLEWE